jgi:hypothetical protein
MSKLKLQIMGDYCICDVKAKTRGDPKPGTGWGRGAELPAGRRWRLCKRPGQDSET